MAATASGTKTVTKALAPHLSATVLSALLAIATATELGGPIAYVDTEHGSASKYADLFSFDVIEPDQFDPRELIQTIRAAIEAGYKVICIDSLSHYWMGKGGELEMVDNGAKRAQGNSFAAWKNVTPIHNELIDTIISAPIHIIVSMRTKTEWVVEEDARGKKVPRKIGLAPVMRDGIEFEFDLCGDMDQENTLTITKSRCPELAGKAINRPGKDMARTMKAWLTGAPAPASTTSLLPPEMHQPPAMNTTHASAPTPKPAASAAADKPWTTFKGMLERFGEMKELLGEEQYYGILKAHGVEHANAFRSGDKALACFAEMVAANAGAKEAA